MQKEPKTDLDSLLLIGASREFEIS
jgi:hypothetical protein